MMAQAQQATAASAEGRYIPRVKQAYKGEVVRQMMERFGYKNPLAVPRLRKIVVNMGVGEATQNIKILDAAVEQLAAITGQRPVVRRARKSIANFKIREKMPIGCSVTLRGDRMYDFFDRLVSIALPRVRDFRGLPTKSFDGRGNYTVGLQEHQLVLEADGVVSSAIEGLGRK